MGSGFARLVFVSSLCCSFIIINRITFINMYMVVYILLDFIFDNAHRFIFNLRCCTILFCRNEGWRKEKTYYPTKLGVSFRHLTRYIKSKVIIFNTDPLFFYRYGNDSSSGLPPNSTLHFDVELKAIS